MNARPLLRPTLCALTALMALGLGFDASAQSVSTTPVGAVTVTIAAGTGAVRNATIASFPLITSVVTSGAVTGTISSITANSITCTGAGWTASDLSQPALPYLVKITSGSAVGRTFLVTANTADTLTISASDGVSSTSVDLTQLGILVGSSGDKFQIENADTLLTLFGAGDSTGVGVPLGNSNPSLADTIQLNVSNSFQTYYYDPSQSAWINLASEVPSNNVIIRPDMAVIYNRLKNAPLTITLTGSVPSANRKSVIRSGQITILSAYWPTDKTLANSGLSQLSGWVSNVNPGVADLVQMRVSSSWQTYYHDGASWINLASEIPSDNVVISPGTGVIIKKRALTGTAAIFSQTLPYSL